MNISFRYKLAVLGVLALLGGGCTIQNQVTPAPAPAAESSDTKSVDIGQGIQMRLPSSWIVNIHEGLVYVNTCGVGLDADTVFCKNNILVSTAATAPEALLEFSNKYREWAWYCPGTEYGECPTDKDKLAQVEQKGSYWIARTLGIAESAAVAFEYKGKFIVVLGEGDTEKIYQEFVSRLQ